MTLLSLALMAACGSQPASDDVTTATDADKATEKAADAHAEPAPGSPEELVAKANAVFKALPEKVEKDGNPITDAKVELGRALYYETRMSKNHDIACNSCHQLDGYGVDGEPTSPGHKGARGDRNSPTVYNAALHVAQFWDGRAEDVEAQAKGPVLNPVEMAMASEEVVVSTIASIPGYPPMFKAAFPDDENPVTYDNMANAIGAFERQLVTPGPFDAFLGGDTSALTDAQQQGLRTYLEVGCATCHNGAALGGSVYMKLGQVEAYETEDEGRFKVTGDEADKYFFKVPSLRNIEKTGPYFHDGSIATLDEAVKIMAKHQLGKELSEEQVGQITAFLGALTGELPSDYIAKPELPESGPDTPKPDPS